LREQFILVQGLPVSGGACRGFPVIVGRSGANMIRLMAALLGVLVVGAPAAAAVDDPAASRGAATRSDAETGLREIAVVAVRRSADDLGKPGGFYLTPKFHIPLPAELDGAVATLAKNYASSLSVAVEKAINGAAEATAPAAGDYMTKAAAALRFAQPEDVLSGPPDAVTATLKEQTETEFRAAMLPVVRANLAAANAQAALEAMRAGYEHVADAPLVDFDLERYTLDSFVKAFFRCVAEQEGDIRTLPSARPTESLKRLFSGK
jgi:hypothetical protein